MPQRKWKMRVSFLHRVFDLIAPRYCCICNGRLAPEEDTICLSCNLHLPRTSYLDQPYGNDLAKVFWGRVQHIEKATALMFHYAGSESAYPIYNLKYHHRPEVGISLGRILGLEMIHSGFTEGIDCIIPVPLSRNRQSERGYNQSELIAQGISEVCHLQVKNHILSRRSFHGSQTSHDRWERNANVEHAFMLTNGDKIRNSHVLLVDDIVTTGATMCACAALLDQIEGIKISVASIGFVDPKR